MMAVAPAMRADPARGVGFAKTMMFAGGSPEIQKLVNQALAARAEANGAGAPHAGRRGTERHRAHARRVEAGGPAIHRPRRRRSRGPPGPTGRARVGRTARRSPPRWWPCRRRGCPAAGSRGRSRRSTAASQATPPPVAALRRPQRPPAPPAGQRAASGRGRQTSARRSGSRRGTSIRWSPMRAPSSMRRAPRRAPKPRQPRGARGLPPRRAPLEDRYVDDGSVSADDRKKYSLRSGATSHGAADGRRRRSGRADERRRDDGRDWRPASGPSSSSPRSAVVAGRGRGDRMAFRGKDVAKGAAALTPVPVQTQPTAAPGSSAASAAGLPPAPAAAAPAAADARGGPGRSREGPGRPPSEEASRPRPRPAAKKHAAKKTKGKKHL